MLIHEIAGGIPRTINVVADNALVSGFAMQQRPVTSHVVAEVGKDFDLTRASAGMSQEPPAAPADSAALRPPLRGACWRSSGSIGRPGRTADGRGCDRRPAWIRRRAEALAVFLVIVA